MAGAQAEIEVLGAQMMRELPAPEVTVRPRVVPYTYPFTDMDDPENAITLAIVQLLVLLLVAAVAVNVAILVYARTTQRQAEIVVRTAIGADRARIVGQLFIEALLLSALAAVLGLGFLHVGLRQVYAALLQMLP